MSTLEARTIEPQSGTTVTLGASGDSVVIGADALKTNTVKAAGGNTLFTSDGAGTLSNVNSGLAGNMVFINSAPASGDTSLSFTSGIDSTYDEYVFYFVGIHPATDATTFEFNASDDTSSWSYDVVKTTTVFDTWHTEDGSSYYFNYNTTPDIAQGTGYQTLADVLGNDANQCAAGELHLFNPSSTTYVKHFYATIPYSAFVGSNYFQENFIAGYFNTTSAITAIDFKMSSGNIDAGTIYLYGMK